MSGQAEIENDQIVPALRCRGEALLAGIRGGHRVAV